MEFEFDIDTLRSRKRSIEELNVKTQNDGK